VIQTALWRAMPKVPQKAILKAQRPETRKGS
jgi:hypothetical protein